MSFDLVILSGTRPLTATAARDAYHHIARGGGWSKVLQQDPHVGEFAAAFEARWPETAEVYVSPASVMLSIPGSAPDEVINFIETTAERLGLYLFDPQDGTLYAPDGGSDKAAQLPRATLVCQACGKVIEPGTPYAEAPRLLHMDCMLRELQSR